MMACKLRRYETIEGYTTKTIEKDYSCDEVRHHHKQWKEEFRDKNRTDEIIKSGGRDRCYEDYCQSIDDFLRKCQCNLEEKAEE